MRRNATVLSSISWSNADYDRILTQAASAADIAERNAHFAHLDKILAREFPAIPFFFDVATYLKHAAVRGWPANPDMPASCRCGWSGDETMKHIY